MYEPEQEYRLHGAEDAPDYSPKFRAAFKRFIKWLVREYGKTNALRMLANADFIKLVEMFRRFARLRFAYSGAQLNALSHYWNNRDSFSKIIQEALEEMGTPTTEDLNKYLEEKPVPRLPELPEKEKEKPLPKPKPPTPEYKTIKVPAHSRIIMKRHALKSGKMSKRKYRTMTNVKGYTYFRRIE